MGGNSGIVLGLKCLSEFRVIETCSRTILGMSEYLGTSKRDMGLNTAPLDMCVLGSADC